MNDQEVEDLIRFINDQDSSIAVSAERAFLKKLGGGCQVPIAAYARIIGVTLRIDGLVGTIDGKRLIREYLEGTIEEAGSLGMKLAEILLDQGAKEVLEEVYKKEG
jgi:hydroxymethylbilane synthase